MVLTLLRELLTLDVRLFLFLRRSITLIVAPSTFNLHASIKFHKWISSSKKGSLHSIVKMRVLLRTWVIFLVSKSESVDASRRLKITPAVIIKCESPSAGWQDLKNTNPRPTISALSNIDISKSPLFQKQKRFKKTF